MEIVRLPKVNRHEVSPAPVPERPKTAPAAAPRRGPRLEVIPGGLAQGPAAAEPAPTVLAAPERLTTETRTEFRKHALETLDIARKAGGHAATIDLRHTIEVDAGGLGLLVFLQKRASDAGMVLNLVCASQDVRRLLQLTRLDHLFTFER